MLLKNEKFDEKDNYELDEEMVQLKELVEDLTLNPQDQNNEKDIDLFINELKDINIEKQL